MGDFSPIDLSFGSSGPKVAVFRLAGLNGTALNFSTKQIFYALTALTFKKDLNTRRSRLGLFHVDIHNIDDAKLVNNLTNLLNVPVSVTHIWSFLKKKFVLFNVPSDYTTDEIKENINFIQPTTMPVHDVYMTKNKNPHNNTSTVFINV